MSDPTTPTGKRLASASLYSTEGAHPGDILAIEAEAAQQERERLRAAVEAHQDEVPYCPAASEMYEFLEEPTDAE